MNDETEQDDAPSAPIQAIINGADALAYISRSNQGVGVRELARSLRLARGTAARVLHSLHVCGLLRRDDLTGRYHLGAKFLELASEHRRRLSLNETARVHMAELSERFRETVFLGVLDGNEVVILDRVDAPQALRMTGELGTRKSVFLTGLGKIMLSALPRSELNAALKAFPEADIPRGPSRQKLAEDVELSGRRGWSLDDGEQVEGVRCVAAAIMDQERRVVAAISVSGPAFRLPDDQLPEVARHVMAAAAAISRDLGYVPVAIGVQA